MKRGSEKTFNYILLVGAVVAVLIWVYGLSLVGADSKSTAKLTFFDVGQGDAALISLPDSKQILVDTGEEKEVLEKIETQMPLFDRKIEYLVLSHADSDHVGVASEIISSFAIGEIIVGSSTSDSQTYKKIEENIKEKNIKVKKASAGEVVCLLSDACLNFLSPEKEAGGQDTNDLSLVFKFNFGEAKVMFTGDAEEDVQSSILKKYGENDLKSQILKVAHHGSKKAINNQFLKEVDPKTAIISVGENSYGHPSEEALKKLTDAGVEILRTDKKGDLSFRFENGSWAL